MEQVETRMSGDRSPTTENKIFINLLIRRSLSEEFKGKARKYNQKFIE